MLAKNEYIRIFRAFTDENRVRILELLCKEGEQCACILLDDLKISQPTLSHHMKILCESGIVKSRPVGKWSYYSINDSGCEYANRLLSAIINHNMEHTLRIMSSVHRFIGYSKILQRLKKADSQDDASACCCTRNY